MKRRLMPEMVKIAGGFDKLARKGADSVRIPRDDVLQWQPEVLIVTPCGLNLDKAIEQSVRLPSYSGWADLPAVRAGRVYAVDANFYLARPRAESGRVNEVIGPPHSSTVVRLGRPFTGIPPVGMFNRRSEQLRGLILMRLRPFSDQPQRKNCSVCHASFTCGLENGPEKCWCGKILKPQQGSAFL